MTRAWSRSGCGDRAPELRHDMGNDARILGYRVLHGTMRYLKPAGEHVMDEPVGGVLSHAALFYRSQPEYADRIAAFIQAGLDRGEPALLALAGNRIRIIAASVESAPGEVVFVDMTELGRNPARIIPEVRSFTDKHPGQRVRFVGEPVWPGRSLAEIREATRHE